MHYDPAVDAWLRRQYGFTQKDKRVIPKTALEVWVESLRSLEIGASDSASAPHIQPCILTFVLEQEFGKLRLGLLISRQRKNGDWTARSAVTPAQLFQGTKGSSGISEEDRRLVIDLAYSQSVAGSVHLYLEGKRGAELLQQFVSTGRCFWRSAGSNQFPLKLAGQRTGNLYWEILSGGHQKAAITVIPTSSVVLDLEPFWYIDTVLHECGPINFGVAQQLVRVWLNAPVIAPAEAETVATALVQQPLKAPLPRPRKLQVKSVADVQPIPCLKLFTERLDIGDGRPKPDEDSEMSFARVEFDYLGIRISHRDPDDVVSQVDGETLREIRRRPNLETRFVEQFEAGGLTPVALLETDEDLAEHREDYASDEPSVWLNFVAHVVPQLQKQGWQVEIDPGFQWRLAEAGDWTTDAFPDSDGAQGNKWFDVELGVIVDGAKVNLLPLLVELLTKNPHALTLDALSTADPAAVIPLRLPDGRFLMFPMARARQMLAVLLELFDQPKLTQEGRLRLSRLRAAELASHENWRWLGPTELAQLAIRLKDFKGIQAATAPPSLQASLRPYQQEGLNWLQFLREYELAGVLADDMGLGKTVQTLAHLLIEKESRRADRPSLVVAPTTLMTNWRQEAARFAPSLKVLILHGGDRQDQFDGIRNHDLILTTYSLLPRDLPKLLEHEFHYVILDEAQYIKNPKTTYAQSACELKARHRLCLTGTPIENHLGELWSLFHFLLPGFLGTEPHFNSQFRRPIERQHDKNRRQLLSRRVTPFVLRRLKEQVAVELPPKTEIVQNIELGTAQRDLYESVRLAMHSKVRQEISKKGMARSHIIFLDALLKLRQICCHPQLLSIPAAKRVDESAKLDHLMDLVPQMLAEGRRILLFSQFTSMLAFIEAQLKKARIDYVQLTGETQDRATPIERFQKGEVSIFLISLKAGGTGLNLTAADTVIHYDPWWNPAVENQATDRAHRIGQQKKVFVYKLLTTGTVEEKIAAMQERKRGLVEGLLNAQEEGKAQLTAEDIDFLLGPSP